MIYFILYALNSQKQSAAQSYRLFFVFDDENAPYFVRLLSVVSYSSMSRLITTATDSI